MDDKQDTPDISATTGAVAHHGGDRRRHEIPLVAGGQPSPGPKMPYTRSSVLGSSDIRLLMLEPGDFDDPVICDLSVEPIDNRPPFEALSYAWGTAHSRETIQVCSKPFSATINLAQALRHLRYEDRVRVLWADAVCINQSNTEEVNAQLRHMNHIYSLASGVIAWIGMDELNGRKAFEIMRHLVLGAARADDDSDTDDDDTTNRLTRLTSRDYAILDSFFRRSYWTRLWIVQELVLATDIQFVCEDAYLPWPVVHRLFAPNASISKGGSIFRALPFALQMDMWRARHLWASRQTRGVKPLPAMAPSLTQLSLLQLLNKFNPCRCLLPRDHVYALLGMCSDTVRELIIPDYTATATTDQAVFQAATAACILEQQNLNVLALLRRYAAGCPDEPAASSWAGEWSTVRIIRPIVEPDDAVQMFQAATVETGGRRSVFTREHNMRFAPQGVLALSGVVVDTLGLVREEIYPYAPGWEESLRDWEPQGVRERAYKLPALCKPANGEVPEENALQAYVRTLLLDSGYTIRAPKHGRMTADQMVDRVALYEWWTSDSRAAGGRQR
ncbi:HET domain-containing protein [Microdochium nivale]|nr:HET domain-containing protein [Microdochium nivale]